MTDFSFQPPGDPKLSARPLFRPVAPEITLPTPGRNLRNVIIEALEQRELMAEGLKVRSISVDRLEHVRTNGTDRGPGKVDGYHDDGEREAMIAEGLSPNFDADRVTYVCDLDSMKKREVPNDYSQVFLVYLDESLRYIGGASNGFARFEDGHMPSEALVAIFKRER